MDNKDLLQILNYHFVRELEATLVYTRNSFIMEPCDPSRVTEAISVDEMRHMWWLAELIVNMGGKPTMEHKELDFGGDDLKSQLEMQVRLESEGIDLYNQHIGSIDDEEVVGVLKHILDEEKRHRKEFKIRLEKLESL